MVVFNWLHLTDLHLGMKGSKDIWQNVEEDFFNDLEGRIKGGPKIGTLDLVIFTGDLVQSGRPEEFAELEAVLERLWERFEEEMDFPPMFLAVPGNHDLTRPPESTGDNPNPSLDTLMHLWHLEKIQEAFWMHRESPQRDVVSDAFTNYVEWWEHTSIPKPDVYWKGELPGDFSATIAKDGFKLGIVGLNSTFLQLIGGDLQGKLALSLGQFNRACGGSGAAWAAAHDFCLLLTHQPPEWLTPDAQNDLAEIHNPPRFALHLYGHMHERLQNYSSKGGAKPTRRLQGSSLFSMEVLRSGGVGRKHGYSLGQLTVLEDDHDHAELRIWPREASRKPDRTWRFGADGVGILDENNFNSTPVERIERHQPLRDYQYPVEQDHGHDPDQARNDFKEINPPIAAIDPILIARLDSLQQKLSRIRLWLSSELESRELEADFTETLVNKNIGVPLTSRLNDLDDIYKKLARLDPDNKKAVSRALKTAWREYHRAFRESQEIFLDSLELMGGLALRDKQVKLMGGLALRDKQVNDRFWWVADELIRATTKHARTPWFSFTVPAQREAYRRTISRIIRLRFPEWTIWSVPIAAHEFGHVVIEDENMFGELVDAQDNEWKKRHLHVVLADAFATYVMGPAYVCASISLWLNPSKTSADSNRRLAPEETYLSDATRAQVMFAVLNRMNDRARDDLDEEPYKEIIWDLKQRWEEVLRRQDKPSKQQAQEIQVWARQELEELVDTALRELDNLLLEEEGRYPHRGTNGIKVAEMWAAEWQNQLTLEETLAIPRASSRSTLRDALNAAWLCRIRCTPDKVDLIADAAYELCAEVIEQSEVTGVRAPVGQPTPPPGSHQVGSRRQSRRQVG